MMISRIPPGSIFANGFKSAAGGFAGGRAGLGCGGGCTLRRRRILKGRGRRQFFRRRCRRRRKYRHRRCEWCAFPSLDSAASSRKSVQVLPLSLERLTNATPALVRKCCTNTLFVLPPLLLLLFSFFFVVVLLSLFLSRRYFQSTTLAFRSC